MFSKHTKKEDNFSLKEVKDLNLTKSDVPSIVASDMQVIGNLVSSGAIEIEGVVRGNINCANVSIRESGSVKGDIVAEVINIDGTVDGVMRAQNIVVAETGKVSGMLVYEMLSVKDGAAVDGQCKRVSSYKDAEDKSFSANLNGKDNYVNAVVEVSSLAS